VDGIEDYIIFDCPGQVELFTHHNSIHNIFAKLEKLGYRVCLHQNPFSFPIFKLAITNDNKYEQLVVIHLLDSHHLASPSQYISILLTALRSMLLLNFPHINVLSKLDLLKSYGPLPFNLDFYTEVQDLSHLLPFLETEQGSPRFSKLNEAICDLVDGFGLVGFETLAVEDKASMTHLLQVIDRAGGYVFGEAEGAGDSLWTVAMRENWGDAVGGVLDVQERWVDNREEYDEFEREREEVLAKQREKEWKQKARNAGEYVSDSEDEEEEDEEQREGEGQESKAGEEVQIVER